ncbi:MAG: 50S ribosomal protein L10 [Planctomycetota bacterium]|jgi:large subunit ribosomal protein L10|nr:50S ribosomal protein L10 [Planctomycetota bacterium]MDP7129451.1 50S ribosomal protein L10 [Planctomycetota bacterium]MDP7250038.1 50S ribosomal protein L10 [Planctomycetota bacterium]
MSDRETIPSRLKTLLRSQLKDEFEPVEHGIFVDYRGLTVMESDALRGDLVKKALKMQVIRNRIAKRALIDAAGVDLTEILKGPIAVIYGNDDPVEAAKIVLDVARANDKVEVRGGFADGKALNDKQVDELSRLPTRDQLLAQILGAIQSPAQTFVSGINEILSDLDFNGVARELHGLFTAYNEKLKEEGGE